MNQVQSAPEGYGQPQAEPIATYGAPAQATYGAPPPPAQPQSAYAAQAPLPERQAAPSYGR
jgi:hypothetical protein